MTATNADGTGPSSAASSSSLTPRHRARRAHRRDRGGRHGDEPARRHLDGTGDTGGSAITGYTVTSSPGGATCTTTGATTVHRDAGLTNKTAYTFTVTATNADGHRARPRPPPRRHGRRAGRPDGGDRRRHHDLDAVGGQLDRAGQHRRLPSPRTRRPRAPEARPAPPPATTTCTVTGLTTKTSYTFTVTATNTNGTGPASAPSNAVIAGTPPSPTGVTATARRRPQSAPSRGPTPVQRRRGRHLGLHRHVEPVGDHTRRLLDLRRHVHDVCRSPGSPPARVHVHGLGHQHQRHRVALRAVRRHPGRHAGGSDPPVRTSTQRLERPQGLLDGTGQQRWIRRDQLHGHGVAGRATCTATAPTTNCTVTGLSSATTYTFTVTATNTTGTGPPSSATTGVSG